MFEKSANVKVAAPLSRFDVNDSRSHTIAGLIKLNHLYSPFSNHDTRIPFLSSMQSLFLSPGVVTEAKYYQSRRNASRRVRTFASSSKSKFARRDERKTRKYFIA